MKRSSYFFYSVSLLYDSLTVKISMVAITFIENGILIHKTGSDWCKYNCVIDYSVLLQVNKFVFFSLDVWFWV